MKRWKRAILIIATMCFFAANTGCSVGTEKTEPMSARQTPSASLPTAALQTPAKPNEQSGKLDTVLLDGAELYACATGYSFRQNEGIWLDITAKNASGNPATVWILFSDVNGWDVQPLEQSMTNVSLSPGEERTFQAAFDLSGETARYLQIAWLERLKVVAEGYVDTTDYDYLTQEHVLTLPDAPQSDPQSFGEPFDILADNAYFRVAYCGSDESSGTVTLFYEPKEAGDGMTVKLYPMEDGVYDTQRYLIPDTWTMQYGAKRLYSFVPAKWDGTRLVTGFFAVADGNAIQPVYLTIPVGEARELGENRFSGMTLAAQDERLSIYYDAAERRFYAQNKTQDETLMLRLTEPFTLDGAAVRPNPLTVPCFPGTATAFRISGRMKDENQMERNVVIEEQNQILSAMFDYCAPYGPEDAPQVLGTITMEQFSLEEGSR